DALRKAQAAPRPEPAAAAPLPPLSSTPHGGPQGALPSPLPLRGTPPRPALVPFMPTVSLSEEAVREMSTLRVNLSSALGSRQQQTIMFVSPQGGEGASTVTQQFAQFLARDARLRILIVDGHLARPAFPEDHIASLTAAREAGGATL